MMDDRKMDIQSALTEFDFSSLLNVHFFIFSPIFFNKCQTLLPGLGISAIDDGNINMPTER